MTLMLNNQEVESLLAMPEYVAVLEEAFADLARGHAVNRPRSHTYVPGDGGTHYLFKSMDGAWPRHGVHALRLSSDVVRERVSDGRLRREKLPAAPGGKWVGLVLLFSMRTGEPLAILQDGYLQRMRVGATSALAAKYLSRPESAAVGLYGSGWQAGAQLMGLCHVRPVASVRVYSPSRENRERFARDMTRLLGVPVTAVDEPRRAAEGVDILVCATNSLAPVLDGRWLEPGMHVNSLQGGELDDAVIQASDVIAVRSLVRSSHHPAPGLAPAEVEKGPQFRPEDEEKLRELGALIVGEARGRTSPRQITLFGGSGTGGSSGLGIQFAAVAHRIYGKARAAGAGREIPTEWFLEDVHP